MKRAVNTTTERHCWDCKKWYPATTEYFYKDSNRSLGLTNDCKECHKARARRWNRNNPERHKGNFMKYYNQHYRSTGAQMKAEAA
jgi:hypothetical protein